MDRIHSFTLVLTIAAAIFATWFGFRAINLSGLAGADIGTLFLTLIFTALVIERAVEVVANNRFMDLERKAAREVRETRQALTLAEEALQREYNLTIAVDSAPETRAKLLNAKEEAAIEIREDIRARRLSLNQAKNAARPRLEELRHQKQRFTSSLATGLGLLAAMAGVRILGQFLPLNEAKEITGPILEANYQIELFRFTDVALTAMLLAGGADAIHGLLKDFLSKRTDVLDS